MMVGSIYVFELVHNFSEVVRMCLVQDSLWHYDIYDDPIKYTQNNMKYVYVLNIGLVWSGQYDMEMIWI